MPPTPFYSPLQHHPTRIGNRIVRPLCLFSSKALSTSCSTQSLVIECSERMIGSSNMNQFSVMSLLAQLNHIVIHRTGSIDYCHRQSRSLSVFSAWYKLGQIFDLSVVASFFLIYL